MNLREAVEAFLAAHQASSEAWANLTRAQYAGVAAVSPEAEYLHDEAQYRWDLLATKWVEGDIPAEARRAGREYARPKVVHVPVVQSGPVDWSRSGRSAA